MTFVISAFQMFVLRFGHFFENRKSSGLTLGQNDDPVTRTWKMTQMTRWPGDPVPCLIAPAFYHVTFASAVGPGIMLQTELDDHCDKLAVDRHRYFQLSWPTTFQFTEWLLLRRCNLSNIGGRVYVRVMVRASVRVIFSITWYVPDTVTYVWQVAAS